MDKCVMVSIKPEFCNAIFKVKQKMIEVRKSKPNLEIPFKVYVYCTRAQETLIDVLTKEDFKDDWTEEQYEKTSDNWKLFLKNDKYSYDGYGGFNFQPYRMMVVGEFTCVGLVEITPELIDYYADIACVTQNGLKKYIGDKTGYGWHIENPILYKDPKELSEFRYYSLCDSFDKCSGCSEDIYNRHKGNKHTIGCGMRRNLKQPPQSWCYVEELMEIKKKGLFGRR